MKNYTWQADLNSQHDGNLLGDLFDNISSNIWQ